MKIKIWSIVILSALLLSAGCSSSDDGIQKSDEGVPIMLTCSEISATETMTRADIAEHPSINGEVVNIYMPSNTLSGPIEYAVAAATDAGGVSALTPASTVYLYPDYTPIYGFYPTAATMSANNMTYSVNTDQSTAANYKLSDLLFAKNEIYKSNIATPVNLEFHHLMSKVIVNVTVDPTIVITGVFLINVDKTIEFTPSTYTISHDALTGLTSSNNVGDGGIKAGTTATCAALIPPQKIRNINFIKITAQGAGDKSAHSGAVNFFIPYQEPMTFLPGKTYSLTLAIDRWSFGQTMDISIDDWDDGGSAGEPRLSPAR